MNPSDVRQFLDILDAEYSSFIRETALNDFVRAAGICLLLAGIGCFVGHLLTSRGSREPRFKKSAPQRSGHVVQMMVATLLMRADELRLEARHFMTFIFLLSIGSIVFFHLAGDLNYEDRAAARGLLNEAQGWAFDHGNIASEIESLHRDTLTEAAFIESNETIVAAFQNAGVTSGHIVELEKARAPSSEVTIALNNNVLISSITARVGIVLIAGFLIKILLSSYKYSTQLAAFYSSRAYALMLVNIEVLPISIDEFVKVLEPHSVTFSRDPDESFVASAVNLRKTILPE